MNLALLAASSLALAARKPSPAPERDAGVYSDTLLPKDIAAP